MITEFPCEIDPAKIPENPPPFPLKPQSAPPPPPLYTGCVLGVPVPDPITIQNIPGELEKATSATALPPPPPAPGF
jgi:hypothetical protein